MLCTDGTNTINKIFQLYSRLFYVL